MEIGKRKFGKYEIEKSSKNRENRGNRKIKNHSNERSRKLRVT